MHSIYIRRDSNRYCIVDYQKETVIYRASDNVLGRGKLFKSTSALTQPYQRVELVHPRCHGRPIAVDVVDGSLRLELVGDLLAL